MKPVEALTLIAGHVSDEILLRNEYLAAENEILRSKLGKKVPLTNGERKGNALLSPSAEHPTAANDHVVKYDERASGLLSFYHGR